VCTHITRATYNNEIVLATLTTLVSLPSLLAGHALALIA
jgi:hypothetical protein